MKKILFACILVWQMSVPASGQSILAAEYFFDVDPGQGNGFPLQIPVSGDSVLISDALSTTSLAAGFHTAYIRTIDTLQLWSLYRKINFYIEAPVLTGEYFFDVDPGQGNGFPLQIPLSGDSVLISDTLSTTGLPAGFHSAYIRTIDTLQVWSLYKKIDFYIEAPVIAAEYFFDTDPGQGNGIPLTIPLPSTQVNLNEIIATDTFPPGQHSYNVRFLDASGRWSHYKTWAFNLCSMYGPLADFNLFIDNSTVYFDNKSQFDSSHTWNYGDGNSDSLINPSHQYLQPGEYTICLVASNICGSDTLCKDLTIRGIQKASTGNLCNDGFSTVFISGFGFLDGSTAKLIKAGQPDVTAKDVIFQNKHELKLNFKIQNAAIGYWSLVVTDTLMHSDTLLNYFLIDSCSGFPIEVDITGRTSVIINREYEYSIKVTNKNNYDVFAIPVFIEITGLCEAEVISKINLDSVPSLVIDSVPDFFWLTDSLTGDSALHAGFVINYMPGNSTRNIHFSMRSLSTNDILVEAFAGTSVLSTAQLDTLDVRGCKYLPFCLNCALTAIGVIPVIGCATGAFQYLCSITQALADPEGEYPGEWSLIKDFSGVMLNCLPVPLQLKDGHIQAKLAYLFWKDFMGYLAGFYDIGNEGDACITRCKPPWQVKKLKPIKTYFSIDPNIKTGTAGINANNFISGKERLHYIIFFENADSATASVTEVRISDAIDTTLFDINSVKFHEVGFSDTAVLFSPSTKDSFALEMNLYPDIKCLLRASGLVDKFKGTLEWNFYSLDSTRYGLIDNPTDGFLPPNISSPEGEAYVIFSIQPKAKLPHLQVLTNKASIIFDNNQPFITPNWVNTIDTVKPQSAVQPLSLQQADSVFTLNWTGFDSDAGVMSYNIYASVNDSNFFLLISETKRDSAVLKGKPGYTYEFFSQAIDFAGNIEDTTWNPDAVTTVVVGLSDPDPQNWISSKNQPNPFTESTTIEFYLLQSQKLYLEVSDLFGRVIYSTIEQHYVPGISRIKVNLKGHPPGIYHYKLISRDGFSETGKMVLLK